MKEKTCCFTGHRDISSEQGNKIKHCLTNVIEDLICEGFLFFGCGGALGFDTMAAETVLRLRRKHPQIKLILVLPCLNQDKYWSENDSKVFQKIKDQADKTVYTAERYYRGCMQKRDRHLVDNSSCCVCYLTRENGGTAYTVRYAEAKQLKIINVAQCANCFSV